MSEEQGKPKSKGYKKRSTILALSLLLVMCAIAAYVFISMDGGVGSVPHDAAYKVTKNDLQTAMKAYQSKNNGELPTIKGTVTINTSDYQIIDICTLLLSEDWTQGDFPDGCISINGSDNDNCDRGCEGCHATWHYIWMVDDQGTIYSKCIGEDCEANNEDGYQGYNSWP
jgi:hypothetical protein